MSTSKIAKVGRNSTTYIRDEGSVAPAQNRRRLDPILPNGTNASKEAASYGVTTRNCTCSSTSLPECGCLTRAIT